MIPKTNSELAKEIVGYYEGFNPITGEHVHSLRVAGVKIHSVPSLGLADDLRRAFLLWMDERDREQTRFRATCVLCGENTMFEREPERSRV